MGFDWVEEAPCRRADPWLFDQYHFDLSQPALNYCKRCRFWEECESLVEPKNSHFDGICGGKVWRNGRVLAKLDIEFPNRFQVTVKENDDEALELRGSELSGS